MTRLGYRAGQESQFPGARILMAFAILLLCFTFLPVESAAQENDDLPEGVVPPPLSNVAKEEKEQLEKETSSKKRTLLAIELMDTRLTQSQRLADEEKIDDSLKQLGRFTGLMNLVLSDLRKNASRKKSLKNNKKFEIALREFMPRLELIRRALPYSHSYHVAILIKTVRDARRRSIEPFFGDTVLPEGT